MDMISKEATKCLLSRDISSFLKVSGSLGSGSTTKHLGPIDPLICDTMLIEFAQLHNMLANDCGTISHPNLITWLNSPLISYCYNDHNQRINHLKRANGTVNLGDQNTYALILAQSMMAYTLCQFQISKDGFMMLNSWHNMCGMKNEELQSRVALCHYHLGEYDLAVCSNPNLYCAWELLDPSAPAAFSARSRSLKRKCKTQYSRQLVSMQNESCIYSDELISCHLLKNVTFGGVDPMIYDSDAIYVGNRENVNLTSCDPSPVNMSEIIVIPSTNADNFYHTLIEFGSYFAALARLDIATTTSTPNPNSNNPNSKNPNSKIGIPGDVPICVYNKAYNSKVQPKMNEIIEMILNGIDILNGIENPVRRRIISIGKHVHVDKLWVIDSVENQYNPPSLWDAYLPSPPALLHLRDCLTSSFQAANSHRRFVYVARRGRGIRSLEDDANLVKVLSQWSHTKNLIFTCCDGTTTVGEQREIFSGARIIWGIHGAGLSNMMWAPPDCHVFEVGIKHRANKLFERLSQTIGMTHDYVKGVECEYHIPMNNLTDADCKCVSASLQAYEM